MTLSNLIASNPTASDRAASHPAAYASPAFLRLRLRWLCLGLFSFAGSGCYLSHYPEGHETADGGVDASSPDAPFLDTAVAADRRCAFRPIGEELTVAVDPDGNVYAPDIFWTGERVAVVMSEDNAGSGEHGVVSMSHADPELRAATPLRLVGENSHGWGEAAWNGDGFGLCWYSDLASDSSLRFREFNGGVDGPYGPITSFGPQSGSCLDLVFSHGRYAMTYRYTYRREEETWVDSLVQVVDPGGVPVGPSINMASAPYGGRSPGLVVTDDGFAAAVNVEGGVRVVRFDREGTVTEDRRVPIVDAGYTALAIHEDRMALATMAGPRGQRSLTLRILDRSLRELSRREITDGAPTASYPRLSAHAEGWVLVWGEGSRPTYRAMMLSFDRDGLPMAPRRILYDGYNSAYGGPSLALASQDAGDDELYIGLSHELPDSPPLSREYTHLSRYRCDEAPADLCTAQDAAASRPFDCVGAQLLGWRFAEGRCAPLYDCGMGCRGSDCDQLYVSRHTCESDRQGCLSPTTCEETGFSEADQVCIARTVPSGQPSWMDVTFSADDPCPCERPTCAVTLSGEFELTATLSYCVESVPDCDCDELPARRPLVDCALPPLAPGVWTLNFDGREPVTIQAERGATEGERVCL